MDMLVTNHLSKIGNHTEKQSRHRYPLYARNVSKESGSVDHNDKEQVRSTLCTGVPCP